MSRLQKIGMVAVFLGVACFARAEFDPPVALTNLKIVSGSGQTWESGTIVIREGRIVAVGDAVAIPADARTIDMAGLVAYPGFIDAHSHLGISEKERTVEERTRTEGLNPDAVEGPETLTREAGRRGVRAHFRAAELYAADAKSKEAMRKEGFTAALIAPRDGIFSGSSDIVNLGDAPVRGSILAGPVAQHASFTIGEPGDYPRTILGVFAVFRQTLLDARWHAKLLKWHERRPNDGVKPATDAVLDSLQPALARAQPVIFTANTENQINRALDLGKEFGLSVVISGGKEAWKVAERIKSERVPLIVSLKFDEEPEYGKKDSKKKPSAKGSKPEGSQKSETSDDADEPGTNPNSGPEKQDPEMSEPTKPAAEAGEPEPAPAVKAEEKKSDKPEEDDSKIYEPLKVRKEKRRLWKEQVSNVIHLHELGIPFALTTRDFKNAAEFRKNLNMVIEKGLPVDAAVAALTTHAAEILGVKNQIGGIAVGQFANLAILSKPLGEEDAAVKFVYVNGTRFEFDKKDDKKDRDAKSSEKKAKEKKDSDSAAEESETETDTGPQFESEILADRIPKRKTNGSVVIKNVTILPITSKPIENGFITVTKGKITAMGQLDGFADPPGFEVIDGTGLYAMPGIVDPHSHLGIDGVNESPNAISAEVRIADTIDPGSIAIYRALAGGATTHHAMHGSANPIGGQNVTFKLKYRRPVAELLIPESHRTIKFALGENVVQANFPENFGKRYPTSRMGVESVIRNAFEKARIYRSQWTDFERDFQSGKDPRPLRRDLRLEALGEILAGDMIIHSHCYRSEEILRLLAAAEDYGVRVGVLHHVLEGYRISPEIARHGAGASSFANNWAYKVEAWGAIPQNPALLVRNGVNTTLNSDSPNTIRFMAQEAAKCIKWGGLDETEALRLITINAAQQLGIDSRVGSLEVGKDGDIALFNGHPLDTFSKCVMTLIEGEVYFEDTRPQRIEPAHWTAGPAVGEKANMTIPKTAHRLYAITNATIHPISGPAIEKGSIVILEDKILEVGTGLTPPPGAGVIDGTGLHVYPGLIDAGTVLGLSEIDSLRATRDFREIGTYNPQLISGSAVHPHSELIPIARTAGISMALAKPSGSRVAGQSTVIGLEGWTADEMIVVNAFGLHMSVPSLPVDIIERRRRGPVHDDHDDDDHGHLCENITKGLAHAEGIEFGTADDDLDEQKKKRKQEHEKAVREFEEFIAKAKHYSELKKLRDAGNPVHFETDLTFEAMVPYVRGEKPVVFEVTTYKEILDTLDFAKKHGLRPILYGAQESWKLADRLATENIPVILATTLNYPRSEYEPWDSVYRCAGVLHRAGVRFAFASDSSSGAFDLPSIVGMAVAHGLPREKAEYAMTLGAAEILGIAERVGSLDSGKQADVIVTTGSPAQTVTLVTHMFLAGRPIDLTSMHTRNYEKFRNRPNPKLPPARSDLKGPASLSTR